MTALELMTALGETEDRYAKTVFAPRTKKKLSRPVRTVLILAAVLALLALLGVAAREAGFLERLFPEEKFETIEDYVNHVAVSVENDSLRLTLHEAVTDGYNTYLVYSVERLDGGSLEGWTLDKALRPMTKEGLPAKMGGGVDQPLEPDDPDPSRIVRVWINNGITGMGRIRVRLFGLRNFETGETLTPGYLEAEAELKPCLTKTARRQGNAGGEKVYTDIVLSTFGFRMSMLDNLAGMGEENAPEPNRNTRGGAWNGRLELVYADGTEDLDIRKHAVWRPDEFSLCVSVVTVVFRQVTDIRGVRAVRIEGVEYPLETGPLPRERRDTTGGEVRLDSIRAWLYGDHAPVHPAITAEGMAELGKKFTLALDGVWTDGYTAELLLRLEAADDSPATAVPVERDPFAPVNLGGRVSFEALNEKGEPAAVGVRYGGLTDGTAAYAAECTEKARTLVLRYGDELVLTVPLDMKQLRKLPQTTPKEGRKPEPAQENQEELLAQMTEELFGDHAPAGAAGAADNGVYRLEVQRYALWGDETALHLRALAVTAASAGEYDRAWPMEIQGYLVLPDREVFCAGYSGSFYDSGSGEYVFILNTDLTGESVPSGDFHGDFRKVSAIRLIWTPPAGDRITLELEPTG